MKQKNRALSSLAALMGSVLLTTQALSQSDPSIYFRMNAYGQSSTQGSNGSASAASLAYALASFSEGDPVSVAPSVSGGVGPYTFAALDPLPPGFQINATTGVISGEASVGGNFTARIRATPSQGTPAETVLSIAVASVQQPNAPTQVQYAATPQFTSPGAVYVPSPVVTGGTAPYTYEVLDPLPPGLQFDNTNGSFSGNPTNPGTYVIRVRVTSQGGGSKTTSVTFNVRAAATYAQITDILQNGGSNGNTTLSEKVASIQTQFWYPDLVGLPPGQPYTAPEFRVSSYGDTTTIQLTPGPVVYFRLKSFGPAPANFCVTTYTPQGAPTSSTQVTWAADGPDGMETGFGLNGDLIDRIEIAPCDQDTQFDLLLGGFEMYQ